METTYYTLTAREIIVEGAAVQQVSGGSGRRLVCVRKAPEQTAVRPGGKVIDLMAARKEREEAQAAYMAQTEPEPEWDEGVPECPEEPRRTRTHGKPALAAEILASLSVAAVAIVLLGQVLAMF